jgi:ankyrin repeat protein
MYGRVKWIEVTLGQFGTCVFVLYYQVPLMWLSLASGQEIDHGDQFGRTPLMFTVLADRLECAELLMRAGANVNCKDKGGRTALHWAAHKVSLGWLDYSTLGSPQGKSPVIGLFYTGQPTSLVSSDWTTLHWAAHKVSLQWLDYSTLGSPQV